ncbi:hypothetical protein [Halovibrio sp. HP20-59]|uniref:hypothetical protein n=1 Tax=Halovibrio sp. HP20-59 TaxID=3080275 RepID=UPI002AFEF9FD|nr:hypothetical protein [Halovibrio sp. HP20-59]MEA2119000.1 hypothetical protein [Halovibrio sp. HP20-59]
MYRHSLRKRVAIAFALCVAVISVAWGFAFFGAIKMVVYSLFHDGMVHRRWPIRWQPKSGYLKRLIQAHRIHHAVRTREGAVPFGFLYAPDVRKLKKRLKQQRAASSAGARHDR